MKQLGIGRRALLSAQLMLIVLFCGSGCNSTSSAQTQLATSSINSARTQSSAQRVETWLRAAISSGKSDLRWPDFSDYSKHVKKFYEFNGRHCGGSGMEPTHRRDRSLPCCSRPTRKGSPQRTTTGPDGASDWRISSLRRGSR